MNSKRPEQDVNLAGRLIRRGETVTLSVPAADFDPAVFDDPDNLRWDRPNARRHLAFRQSPLTVEGDGYLHSEDIDGCSSFGVWRLAQMAQACFGTPDRPAQRPVPQASIEFEVADAATVQAAADEWRQKGFTLPHEGRTQPWGQTVARLQSSEGAIIGVSSAPSMHS